MQKTAVCFVYILCSIIYLSPIAEGTRIWYAFNIITQIAFVGYLCYLQSAVKNNSIPERLFFGYLWRLSIANCIYIVICVWKDTYWSIYNTGVFAYILGISFVVLLIHIAIEQHNENHK